MSILKFDPCKKAVINPEDQFDKIEGFPKIGVTCFSSQLLNDVIKNLDAEIIGELHNANGPSPIYKVNYKGVEVALFVSRVGAPACVGYFEEMIAFGLEKCIMFGTCGALDKSIKDLAIIIPTSAIRDEGTSYHYMEASTEVSVNEKYCDEFIELLDEVHYSYTWGKTWTTDAFYRETKDKMELRKAQGAVCVEMECSAMSAVAKFRGVDFFEFFYSADNLDGVTWDKRSLDCADKLDEKGKILILALELATKIQDKNND